MRLRRFAALAAALLVLAAPLAAQSAAIQGTVRDLDGKPIEGAQVVIERTGTSWRYETKADKKGTYFYTGLPFGPKIRYTIKVFRDGQLIFRMTGVTLREQERRRIDVDLAKLTRK